MSENEYYLDQLRTLAAVLGEEGRAGITAFFEKAVEQAAKYESKQLTVSVNIDRSPVDQMLADLDNMKNQLSDHLVAYAKANGYFTPPAGSEWIPVERANELEPREGVIVTDGKTWGLSKYNAHRPNTPFTVIYDVCEWEVMGEITHFRRMTAIPLPNGELMEEPQPVVLGKKADKCPECKTPFHWHQIQGMRLIEELKVKGKPVAVYRALCPTCNIIHWVRK